MKKERKRKRKSVRLRRLAFQTWATPCILSYHGAVTGYDGKMTRPVLAVFKILRGCVATYAAMYVQHTHTRHTSSLSILAKKKEGKEKLAHGQPISKLTHCPNLLHDAPDMPTCALITLRAFQWEHSTLIPFPGSSAPRASKRGTKVGRGEVRGSHTNKTISSMDLRSYALDLSPIHARHWLLFPYFIFLIQKLQLGFSL